MASIDISKYTKAQVLRALYNGSKPLGMGFLHYDPKPMTIEEAQSFIDDEEAHLNKKINKIIEEQAEFLECYQDHENIDFIENDVHKETAESIKRAKGYAFYFDYLQGRVMKISLAGDTLDTRLYDRDNGEGMAEKLINNIGVK